VKILPQSKSPEIAISDTLSLVSDTPELPLPASVDTIPVTLLHFSSRDSISLQETKGLLADGRYTEAEIRARDLLATAERVYGPESFEVAKVCEQLALSLVQKGGEMDSEALSLVKRAIEIKGTIFGQESLHVARTLRIEGLINFKAAKYVEAESAFEHALGISKKALGPDNPEVASVLSNLGLVYIREGKLAEAGTFLIQARKSLKKEFGAHSLEVTDVLEREAILYALQLKPVKAEENLRRVLQIRMTLLRPNHPDIARSLTNLAMIYHAKGVMLDPIWLDSSEEFIKRAEEITKSNQVSIKNSQQRARVIANVKQTPEENSRVRAMELDVLARYLQSTGQYTEAKILFERATEKLKKSLGPEHPLVAFVFSELAGLHMEQGEYKKAKLYYERSWGIAKKTNGGRSRDIAASLSGLALANRHLGDASKAVQLNRQALEMVQMDFRNNSFAMSNKNVLSYLAFLHSSSNEYFSSFHDLPSVEKKTIQKVSDIVCATKGLTADIVFERQEVLNNGIDSTAQALSRKLNHTKHVISTRVVVGAGMDTTLYIGELDSLMKVSDIQEEELARRIASHKKEDYEKVSAKRIAALLPENTALVEFLRYDYSHLNPEAIIPQYIAVVLDASNEPAIVELGEASALDSLIDNYRNHFVHFSQTGLQPSTADAKAYRALSEALYNKCWRPLEKYLTGKREVLIAPDGGLNLVSFAGLMDSDGVYLIEKLAVHYLSAGRDIIRLQDTPALGTGLLAFGDPDYDAPVDERLSQRIAVSDVSKNTNYYAVTHNLRSGCGAINQLTVPPLPGTRAEVERIVETWEQGTKEPVVEYFGADASEKEFKANAHGKRVIHLATHGFFLEGACNDVGEKTGLRSAGNGTMLDSTFSEEDPLLQSGLLLAGSNLHGEGSDKKGAEDGVLTAYEVAGMDLTGTGLVVLSACETGLGAVQDGEGVYGLRRAFQLAGARTVISALWSVSDEATAEILGNLYQHSTESIPDRLRELQLQAIARIRSRHEPDHPFNWAAFVALGDWR